MPADALSIERIRRSLTSSLVGRQLYLFGDVTSTNDKLRDLARSGAPEGTVVLAEAQTAGRGRRGQVWLSPEGVNLYASVLLRPRLGAHDLGVFSFIASIALCETMRELGVRAGVKWPNDVLVDRKKVAGVLAECAVRGDEAEHVILGIGVNLNVGVADLHAGLGPAGRFATSLAAVTGREIDRNAFAASYLNHLDAWVAVFAARGPEPVLAAWRAYDILGGRRVEVRSTDDRFEGRVRGVEPHGALVVEDSRGVRHSLVNEEVRIVD
jgi:BirA family biotin operon repressor/biotin-[acetyl-CoA-carboxylase] ligase